MGILDDLKNKADKARLEQEQEEARLAALEQTYRTGIRPAMLKIHGFLIELTGLLTDSVRASFVFPGIGKVDHLEQKNYNILIDSQRDPKAITFRFECIAKEEKRYSVSPKSAADEACQFLTEQKNVYSDWALRDANRQISGLIIQCKLRVPVELAFEADIEKGSIRVISHNYDGVTEKNFVTKHEDITAEWLDKLGYFILRQDDSFGTLSLSDDERSRIRLLLEEQQRRHETLLANAQKETASDNGRGPKWLNLFNNKPQR
jgi:hypothetical protein